MKRLALFILFGLFFILGHSQTWRFRRYEVWGAASILQYYGDIGGAEDKHFLRALGEMGFKTNPGISFGGIYRYDERWYIQASNTLGIFSQSDKNNSRNASRNFSFRTISDEFSLQGVYYFVKENEKNYYYSMWNRREHGLKKLFRPLSFYTFVGIGGIFYWVKPGDSFKGSPRFVNKHLGLTFPIGLGMKFAYSPSFSMALELGRRFTTTDFLDGYTSATSEHNDIIYILNIKAIYRIQKSKRIRHLF